MPCGVTLEAPIIQNEPIAVIWYFLLHADLAKECGGGGGGRYLTAAELVCFSPALLAPRYQKAKTSG